MYYTNAGKIVLESLLKIKTAHIKPLLSYRAQLQRAKPGAKVSMQLTAEGFCARLEYGNLLRDGHEYISLILLRPDGAEDGRQEILLERIPSNMRPGSYYYNFICPYCGATCRALFCDGSKFFSRGAIAGGYIYRQQTQSRNDREMRGYQESSPARKGGHLEYKGQPTRYARKLDRYLRRRDQADQAFLRITDKLLKGRKDKRKEDTKPKNYALY